MNTINLQEVADRARQFARSDRQREEARSRREKQRRAFNKGDKFLVFGLLWTVFASMMITLILFLSSVGIIY